MRRDLSLDYCLREWKWATACELVDEQCRIEAAWFALAQGDINRPIYTCLIKTMYEQQVV